MGDLIKSVMYFRWTDGATGNAKGTATIKHPRINSNHLGFNCKQPGINSKHPGISRNLPGSKRKHPHCPGIENHRRRGIGADSSPPPPHPPPLFSYMLAEGPLCPTHQPHPRPQPFGWGPLVQPRSAQG